MTRDDLWIRRGVGHYTEVTDAEFHRIAEDEGYLVAGDEGICVGQSWVTLRDVYLWAMHDTGLRTPVICPLCGMLFQHTDCRVRPPLRDTRASRDGRQTVGAAPRPNPGDDR